LGGVLALVLSVLILAIIPFYGSIQYKRRAFLPLSKIAFWLFINTVILLTWIGARPVEEPYVITGQLLTVIYFCYFVILPVLNKW
jgi:ubiquinol-cytochrome c reductase cytochrome b subunit